MIDEIKTSKFLSLVLRHRPELIGIEMDANGWVSVNELLIKAKTKGHKLTFEQLRQLVDSNPKKRFAFNDDLTKIRANQGHSVEIDLGYEKQIPPPILYHGTSEKNAPLILKSGISKMQRHHVHLSADISTAQKVGMRHGKPVIFIVNSEKMAERGIAFYRSDNGVWLTDFVPAEFLTIGE